MVVMLMPPDHLLRPGDRRLIDESCRLGAAQHPDVPSFAEAGARKVALPVRQAQQRLLALPHDDEVGIELLQGSARCRGSMRTYRHEERHLVAKAAKELLRYAQLGRRTTPEQVGWRRGHDCHIRSECTQLRDDVSRRELEQRGVK